MLKESIAEFTDMAQSIKEDTSGLVNSLLREAVAEEYSKIMAEGFDKDDEDEDTEEENEVKDTEIEETDTEDYEDSDTEESDDDEFSEEDVDGEDEEESDDDDEAWDEFDDYKVEGSVEQYDFSKADDDTVVKAYKRLADDDQVVVKLDKQNNTLELKDDSAGVEYLIDLNLDDEDCDGEECSIEIITDDDNINESTMIELVLNEDKDNTGYLGNKYQKQDVLPQLNMTGERTEGTSDWTSDKFPKGKEKRYGKGTGNSTPFTENDELEGEVTEECNVPVKDVDSWGTNGKGKMDSSDKFNDYGVNQKPKTKKVPSWGTDLSEDIEECGGIDEEDNFDDGGSIEEATNVGGAVQQRSKGSKSHIPSGRKKYGPYPKNNVSVAGEYEGDININIKQESMRRKHNQIVAENKEMKKQLKKLTGMMKEAAVTNMSLGQIVKLLNENSTTQDEKQEIYARFNNVKSIKESKDLYNTISLELSKKNKMNINESKQYSVESSQKINENTIYASKDLMTSLDLMHKICK